MFESNTVPKPLLSNSVGVYFFSVLPYNRCKRKQKPTKSRQLYFDVLKRSLISEQLSLEYTLSSYVQCLCDNMLYMPAYGNIVEFQVFKVDAKIGKKYERSPYFIGTRLWNKLSKDIQNSENVYVFKNKVARLYKCYNEKYV